MLKIILILVAFTMTDVTKSNDTSENTLNDIVKDWYIVNDTVMGGRSQADLFWDNKEKTFLFTGRVSLENNGGFASVRGIFPERQFAQTKTICIEVKGDGQEYQLRLRPNRNMDGVAYAQTFATKQDQWQTIKLDINDFKPTWRGRLVPNYRALKVEEIRQVTFMIASKKAGPFELHFKQVRPCETSSNKDYI